MKIEDLGADLGEVIKQLKSKRIYSMPETETIKNQIDPLKHLVYDTTKRPDKKVKRVNPETDEVTDETEPVARIALAIQKLIVKRAVSFVFGNPVKLDCTPEGTGQETVKKALERVMHDIKEKSFNRKVARNLFSCTEVAELWYPVESKHTSYGFDSKYKLRCSIFSPLLGDTLYPYFDETGDMTAFSREFSITKDNKTTTYFETYTEENHYMFVGDSGSFKVVEGFPKKNEIGKIPIVFGKQDQVEWQDVQNLIERLEKLLSNFADTNDYFASPKIFVKGELKGFSKKGESGSILQADGDADAKYLSWDNAPEAVKLEIETLLRMIYTLTQTPDISFDSIKGIGAVSGIALKLLFMDAHLKVADHQEVLDEYLQRRISIVKAFIGKFNASLATDADMLIVEPLIVPYMIRDEASEIKIWTDANGGNPVMSQKASFQKAGLTSDTDADFDQYNSEQSAKNTFNLGEPTQS